MLLYEKVVLLYVRGYDFIVVRTFAQSTWVWSILDFMVNFHGWNLGSSIKSRTLTSRVNWQGVTIGMYVMYVMCVMYVCIVMYCNVM